MTDFTTAELRTLLWVLDGIIDTAIEMSIEDKEPIMEPDDDIMNIISMMEKVIEALASKEVSASPTGAERGKHE